MRQFHHIQRSNIDIKCNAIDCREKATHIMNKLGLDYPLCDYHTAQEHFIVTQENSPSNEGEELSIFVYFPRVESIQIVLNENDTIQDS